MELVCRQTRNCSGLCGQLEQVFDRNCRQSLYTFTWLCRHVENERDSFNPASLSCHYYESKESFHPFLYTSKYTLWIKQTCYKEVESKVKEDCFKFQLFYVQLGS